MDYPQLIDSVLAGGRTQESRYGHTVEVIPARFGTAATVAPNRPHVNFKLGFMELCQLLAGTFDLEAIEAIAPRANMELFTSKMAYGPRLKDQLESIRWALINDPATRQAVAYVGGAADGPTNNQPCTSTIQFLARNGVLHVIVSMRSWDLIKGLPYDMIMFGGLCQAMALATGNLPGVVTVTAGSGHVYKSDLEAGRYPRGESAPLRYYLTYGDFVLHESGKTLVPWGHIVERATYNCDPDNWVEGRPTFIKAY